jgi:hypothetical protein
MGIVVSAILLILLVVLFIREIRQARAFFVFILRALMIVLVSLVLLGFVFRRTVREHPAIDLLVLADESQSMGLAPKLDDEVSAIAGLRSRTRGRIGCYGFGDTVVKLGDSRQIRAEAIRTDMAQALKFAQATRPGAAVLISDGQNNAASDPVRVAQKLGFPVSAIGVGRRPGRDLALDRIRSPNRAVAGDTISVAVRFRSRGFANDHDRVRLLDDGRLLDTRELLPGQDESQQEIVFRIVPATEGRHVYRVIADSMIGEDNYANNQSQVAIQIVPARTRVAYVSNQPSFDTRFLLQWARADRNIELIPLVAITGSALQRVSEKGATAYALGSRINADVLILDNVDEPALGGQKGASSLFSDALLSFAADHGVLVLGGDGFRAGRALAALLPLEPVDGRVNRELQMELTEAGRGNPIFQEGTRSLFSDLPPFWGAVKSKGLRSDAQLWAQSKDGTPLVAMRRNGPGKILEFAGYPLWRAAFSAKGTENDGANLHRFLSNAVRFLALKDIDRFHLATDKLDYFAGEPVSVLLQAISEDGRPEAGLDVRLTISGGNGDTARRDVPISTAMVDQGDGLYEASLDGLGPGRYAARGQVYAQDRRSGDTIPIRSGSDHVPRLQGTVGHEFSVSELSLELSQTGLNDDLLKRIAQATGGTYLPFDSVAVRLLDIRFADYRRVATFDPRLNRYLFLAIAALFVLEIFLRKRRGML